MKLILDNWRGYLSEFKDSDGDPNYNLDLYSFTASIVIDKTSGGDKSETFHEIRVLPLVATMKQVPHSTEEDDNNYYSDIELVFKPEVDPLATAKSILDDVKLIKGVKSVIHNNDLGQLQ